VGIDWLLHSSCCFLNTNTVIMRQLIGTARTLEAEWWQIWGEAWVRGQRKVSQVLGAFGLLDFTILRPVLAWRAFWNLWTVYFFNFPNFFSGRGNSRIRGVRLYLFFPLSSRVTFAYSLITWHANSLNAASRTTWHKIRSTSPQLIPLIVRDIPT
jgi:hypothetical protein